MTTTLRRHTTPINLSFCWSVQVHWVPRSGAPRLSWTELCPLQSSDPLPGSCGCGQNSAPCGCRTDVPCWLWAGLLSAPRSPGTQCPAAPSRVEAPSSRAAGESLAPVCSEGVSRINITVDVVSPLPYSIGWKQVTGVPCPPGEGLRQDVAL